MCAISSLTSSRSLSHLLMSLVVVVRHLGFVIGTMGPPTQGTWWSLSVCKICFESTHWFRHYESFNILRLIV